MLFILEMTFVTDLKEDRIDAGKIDYAGLIQFKLKNMIYRT